MTLMCPTYWPATRGLAHLAALSRLFGQLSNATNYVPKPQATLSFLLSNLPPSLSLSPSLPAQTMFAKSLLLGQSPIKYLKRKI